MFAFFSKALYPALIKKSLTVSPNREKPGPRPLTIKR